MNATRTAVRHLTVRNLPRELAEALHEERQRRGTSLNQTVIDLLRGSLGLGTAAMRSNGLARLAGTWSEADLTEFEAAIASLEEVDEELWR